MKAVRLHREGGPEQLVYEDAPEPELDAGDALIRVHATGITPAELTWAETYRNCDGSDRLHDKGGRRGLFFIVKPDREQLRNIATLMDSGAVRPVIAETIPLAKARPAFERGVAGHT